MIARAIEYAKSISASDEILQWLETTAKKAVKDERADVYVIEHVIDWLKSSDAPSRLRKLSIEDALRKSNEWAESNKKKGLHLKDEDVDLEVFMEIEEFKIVKLLTKNAFLREGTLMSHCLGGYNQEKGVDIFSLRDEKNNPHATFEVRTEDKEVVQIKGKGNGCIHPKYINSVLKFLEKVGMDVRKEDMTNLGYYHIHDDLIDYAKTISNGEQLNVIGGNTFVFSYA